MMLRSSFSRLARPAVSALRGHTVLQGASSASTVAAPGGLARHAALLQAPARAFSNWLSGPRGSLGAPPNLEPNKPVHKDGDEENSTASGPHFDIQVFDVEQATDGLFRQGMQPRAFLLMHDLPQASLDEIAHMEPEVEGIDGTMQCIKRTYQPSVIKKKRRHGFLRRLETKDGRKVLLRRKQKGRARLAV